MHRMSEGINSDVILVPSPIAVCKVMLNLPHGDMAPCLVLVGYTIIPYKCRIKPHYLHPCQPRVLFNPYDSVSMFFCQRILLHLRLICCCKNRHCSHDYQPHTYYKTSHISNTFFPSIYCSCTAAIARFSFFETLE